MLCPSCGYDNLEGTDRCENCMTPLRSLDVPRAEATEGLSKSVMEDMLGEIGSEETLITDPSTSVELVVERMKRDQRSCALIVDGGKVAGIFTERDVLLKLTGEDARPLTSPISQVMTPHPDVLKETDSVASALCKMSIGSYRTVPIQRADGSFCAISIKHVLHYLAQEDW